MSKAREEADRTNKKRGKILLQNNSTISFLFLLSEEDREVYCGKENFTVNSRK